MNDEAIERAARALYARMGGDPGYAKKGQIGWPALSKARQRPWIKDARAVIEAYENEEAA